MLNEKRSNGLAKERSSIVNHELQRRKAGRREFEGILLKKHPGDEGWIGMAGKHVELKIPLESFNATPQSSWLLSLSPM